jgi:hypothetical protein
MDGFALKQKLAEEAALSYKSIPFVFWSTTASNDQIKKGYDSGGHGFFIKGVSYAEIKESLNLIMTYWRTSKSPFSRSLFQTSNTGLVLKLVQSLATIVESNVPVCYLDFIWRSIITGRTGSANIAMHLDRKYKYHSFRA